MVNAFYFRELRPLINPTRDSTNWEGGALLYIIGYGHGQGGALLYIIGYGRAHPIIHNRGLAVHAPYYT